MKSSQMSNVALLILPLFHTDLYSGTSNGM